jgi:hypothetical protein
MYQLFFTEKEIRHLVDVFTERNEKEFVHLILEQIFQKDLTFKDEESNIEL